MIATIELEEGVRMVSDMVDLDPAAAAIGLPVEVVYDEIDEDITLPRFRVRGSFQESAS